MSINLELMHKSSFNNKKIISKSKQCGCFYCFALFSPSEIKDWVDEGNTSLCPRCGMDSVIGDAVGIEVNKELLTEMKEKHF